MHGPHLMLDCYECDKEKLNDLNLVYKLLDELPSEIGMHKMTLPYVVTWDGGKTSNDPGGISGFVMIAESHVSIHTFPDQGYFTMDLYSCKDFDKEFVVEYVKNLFGAKRIEQEFVHRGKLFRKLVAQKALNR